MRGFEGTWVSEAGWPAAQCIATPGGQLPCDTGTHMIHTYSNGSNVENQFLVCGRTDMALWGYFGPTERLVCGVTSREEAGPRWREPGPVGAGE